MIDESSNQHGVHVEKVFCAFQGGGTVGDLPSAVYASARESLTFWARTNLPDPGTECIFSPRGRGFVVLVISHTKLTPEQFMTVQPAIDKALTEAFREYDDLKSGHKKDRPNKSPDPTPVAVTSPASAGFAPAPAVGHH